MIHEFIGGPVDGLRTTRGRTAFVWVDTRRGHLVYSQPGKCRALYRKATTGTYVFAGRTHALCDGCGSIHETMDGIVSECSLCGGALVSS